MVKIMNIVLKNKCSISRSSESRSGAQSESAGALGAASAQRALAPQQEESGSGVS